MDRVDTRNLRSMAVFGTVLIRLQLECSTKAKTHHVKQIETRVHERYMIIGHMIQSTENVPVITCYPRDFCKVPHAPANAKHREDLEANLNSTQCGTEQNQDRRWCPKYALSFVPTLLLSSPGRRRSKILLENTIRSACLMST